MSFIRVNVTGRKKKVGRGEEGGQSIKRTVHLVIFFLPSHLLSSSTQSVGPCYRVCRHTSMHDVPRDSTALADEARRVVHIYRSDASRTHAMGPSSPSWPPSPRPDFLTSRTKDKGKRERDRKKKGQQDSFG